MAYPTAERAWKAATVMQHKTGTGWRYNAYKCRYCGNYHVGHAPRRYAFN